MRRLAMAATLGCALCGVGGALGRWFAPLDLLNMIAPLTIAGALLGGGVALVAGGGWRAVALTGVALAGAGSRMWPEATRRLPQANGAARADDLRVLSWNMWFDNRDPGATVARLVGSGADVLLLQETSGTIAPALPLLAKAYPYRTRCRDRCGLTILSRRPLLAERYRFRESDGTPFGPGLHWARTRAPDGTAVTLATLHYPHRGGGQAAWRSGLATALARIDRRSLIVAGDMNLEPWTFAMADQDRALRPLWRATRALATWPALLGGHRALPVLPIDHLYAGPAWRFVAAERVAVAGSDHAGIMVTLRYRTG